MAPLPMSQHDVQAASKKGESKGTYKGFVAGVFSGIAKLSGVSNYAGAIEARTRH